MNGPFDKICQAVYCQGPSFRRSCQLVKLSLKLVKVGLIVFEIAISFATLFNLDVFDKLYCILRILLTLERNIGWILLDEFSKQSYLLAGYRLEAYPDITTTFGRAINSYTFETRMLVKDHLKSCDLLIFPRRLLFDLRLLGIHKTKLGLQLGRLYDLPKYSALKGLLSTLHHVDSLHMGAQSLVELARQEFKHCQSLLPIDHVNVLDVRQVIKKKLFGVTISLLELQ